MRSREPVSTGPRRRCWPTASEPIFDVVVLRASTDSAPGEVYLLDPPVLARCSGPLQLGETTRVRLVEADPATGRIAFAP